MNESLTGKAVYDNRQFTTSLPFPYKLWMIVNLETCTFVSWDTEGEAIVMDLNGLEDYLSSPRTIFILKDITGFFKHLYDYGFKRLDGSNNTLIFQHPHFRRHRLDLVIHIRCIPGKNELALKKCTMKKNARELKRERCAKRMPEDPCFLAQGFLSELQRNRIRLSTTLKLQLAEQQLNASLKNMQGGAITLPQGVYENSYDSTVLKDVQSLPEFAGTYGDVSLQQLQFFYDDYLPKYKVVGKEENVFEIDTENTTPSNENTAQPVETFKFNTSANQMLPDLTSEMDCTPTEFGLPNLNFQTSKPADVTSQPKQLVTESEQVCQFDSNILFNVAKLFSNFSSN